MDEEKKEEQVLPLVALCVFTFYGPQVDHEIMVLCKRAWESGLYCWQAMCTVQTGDCASGRKERTDWRTAWGYFRATTHAKWAMLNCLWAYRWFWARILRYFLYLSTFYYCLFLWLNTWSWILNEEKEVYVAYSFGGSKFKTELLCSAALLRALGQVITVEVHVKNYMLRKEVGAWGGEIPDS